MALLDFLKNKEEKEKAKKPTTKKVAKVSSAPKTSKSTSMVAKEKEVVKAETVKSKAGDSFSYTVVKEPHISEKATNLADENKYTFKVYENTNKLEIKKSVEGIYKVNVVAVNIIKSPRKKRRLGKTQGFKKAFTKALVTIKAGQKIEIF